MNDQGYPGAPDYGQPPYGEPQYAEQPPYAPPPPPVAPPPPQYPVTPPTGGHGGHTARWTTAVVVVLAALGVGAYFLFSGSDASASTPTAAVKRLLDAGKADDLAAAKKALCPADNRLGQAARLRSAGRITSYSIGPVRQQDSTHAEVTATVVSANGSGPQTETLPVVRQGGTWKVCLSERSGSGGPASTPSGPAPTVSFPPIAIPSVSIPPIAVPSDLPSIPIDLPSGAGALTSPCALAKTAGTAALTYVGLAEIGETDYAQSCVYKDSVPKSVTASLKATGSALYSPTGDTSGSTIRFTSIDGKSTVAVTATKKAGGKFYITDVRTR